MEPKKPETKKPATPAENEPALPPAAQEVADKVKLGIDYTAIFTLEKALASFNATRRSFTADDGTLVSPEDQQMAFDDAWKNAHAGEFEFRSPGHYDDIAMRVRYNQLSGAIPLDGQTAALINATVVAEKLLVRKPEWFDLAALKPADQAIMLLIAHWYSQWRDSFRA